MQLSDHSSKEEILKNSMFLLKQQKFSILFYLMLFQMVLFFSIEILNQKLLDNIHWKFGSFHIPFLSLKNEWLRFITGSFHHANFLHFMLNMFIMFFTGSFLERILGYMQFFILYFFIILTTSLTSYYILYFDWYHSVIESLYISSSVNIGLLIASFIFLNFDKLKLHVLLRKFLISNFLSLGLFYFFWIILVSYFSSEIHFDYGALLGGVLGGLILPFFIKIIFSDNNKFLEYMIFYSCLSFFIFSFLWFFKIYLLDYSKTNFWLHFF